MTTDRVSGVALVVFASFVIAQSRSLPLGTLRRPGPAYIPLLLALLLLVFAVLLIVTGARRRPLSAVSWTEWRHAAAILAASLFSVLGLERLGYRLTVFLVLAFLLGAIEKRGWMLSLALALAMSFGSFFLFYTVLRVPLPEGPLGF
jgi:putative tricarboxylic transport membrane protein